MNWFTAGVLYALIWWTVLFAVLPFGTRPEPEADAASGWRGAPQRPFLGRKLIATTLISLLIWTGCVWLILSPYLSFRSGWLAMPDH